MAQGTWRYGQFVWHELLCGDPRKALAFYGELFGWTSKEASIGEEKHDEQPYHVLLLANAKVGGLMKLPTGVPLPHWMPYVCVHDVDASVRESSKAGGAVTLPPRFAKDEGRYAVVRDPTGAHLTLYKSKDGDAPRPPGKVPVGTFCWESLMTTDPERAKAFYGTVVGWRAEPGGSAATTVMRADDVTVCDVTHGPTGAPSHWQSHVLVDDLEATCDRAKRMGADIMVPATVVPGEGAAKMGRMSILRDPVGATLSVFERERS